MTLARSQSNAPSQRASRRISRCVPRCTSKRLNKLKSLSVCVTVALISVSSWIGSVTLDLGSQAHAQSLDIKFDSSLSSGVMVGPNGSEVSMRRAPLLLDFDAAFIFDGDESVEWVLGSLIQTEFTPGFALNPQIRLRRKWKLMEGFAGVGLPFFMKPYTRLGTELSFGGSFPTGSALALVAQVNLQTYFWGSDLPENHTVFTINGAVGVRMRF